MKRRNDAKRSYSKVILRKRQTADSGSAFSYKQGKSFLHRCPAWIKILVLPVVSIAVFELPWFCAAALVLLQVIVAFCLRFSFREQMADLRAVLYYAMMLLFVKGVAFVAEYFAVANAAVGAETLEAAAALISEKETLFLLLRLLCVMQSASLVFKTSTSMQLREGLGMIELAVRRMLRPRRHAKTDSPDEAAAHSENYTPIADVVSLFVNFIPQVSKNWQQVKRAWKARGGKNSIRMYMVLLPVLFSVGMKQAYTTARAVSVRNSRI